MDLLAAYSDSDLDSEPEFIDEQPDYEEKELEREAKLKNQQNQQAIDSDSDDDFGPQLPPSFKVTSGSSSGHKPAVIPSTKQSKYSSLSRSELLKEFNLPLDNFLLLQTDHTKMCHTLAMNTAGTALVSGSFDYSLNFFDFSAFDSKFSIFEQNCQSLVPELAPPSSDSSLDYSSVSTSFRRFLKYNKKTLPNEGQIIHKISFPVTCSEDSEVSETFKITPSHFVLTTNTSQFFLYDRNDCGTEIFKSVKGDMYLRDLNHTRGHLMEITDHFFHPKAANILFSCSLDGTVRIWDLENGKKTFNSLTCTHIIKYKSTLSAVSMFQTASSGSSALSTFNYNRIHVHAITMNPNGDFLFASGSDGLIQIWRIKESTFAPSQRTEFILTPPHIAALKEATEPIIHTASSLAVSPDGRFLLARYPSLGQCLVWKLPKFFHTKGASPPPASLTFNHSSPVLHKTLKGVPHISENANFAVSPDSRSVALCTIDYNPKMVRPASEHYDEEEEKKRLELERLMRDNYEGSRLKIFDIVETGEVTPLLDLALGEDQLAKGSKGILNSLYGISVVWSASKNLLLVSLSNGSILINFHSDISKKELQILKKATKKLKNDSYYFNSDIDVTQIIREEDIRAPIVENLEREKQEKKKRMLQKENKYFEAAPTKPDHLSDPHAGRHLASTENAKYAMSVMKKRREDDDSDNDDDPRKKLFKYHQEGLDSRYLGGAYGQSKPVLHDKTFEEEQEEFSRLKGK